MDPQVVASGRSGMRNASAQDQEIWHQLSANWDAVALEAAGEYERLATAHGLPRNSDVADDLENFEGTTRLVEVDVRVNQARFRKAVLASYNATCCISGLQHPRLLVASHIVPWSEDHQNRLNPRNGLCLSALHDRAYDQGLITVMPDFTVKVSQELSRRDSSDFGTIALLRFDGQSIRLPERFKPEPSFLAAHARRFGFLAS
ncbi:HNH endonuclease [Ramlibacter montanisoli]|uniref:HNH endonuclease n=1 Tax=Ramlibacter montanisoli TaxID=2732512 RepID=A0A849KBE8_9BURK|nr:HNH endonuclease [Ramlibacter montanisoli]NNU44750.1 HNH endonuclease [Ramlibacter montanisoli]